jgi:hypothetical protein
MLVMIRSAAGVRLLNQHRRNGRSRPTGPTSASPW